MGSEVIVIEFSDNVLGKIDADIRDAVVRHARGLGIKIHTETAVSSVLKDNNGFEVKATHGKDTWTIQAETVLLAAGRVPAVDDMGLENAGVEFDRGGINVDMYLRTSQPHIWAIGDVRKGSLQLTPPAQYEGRLAAENALSGRLEQINENIVPFFIGITPPIAGVGLTEQEAEKAGHSVKTHFLEV